MHQKMSSRGPILRANPLGKPQRWPSLWNHPEHTTSNNNNQSNNTGGGDVEAIFIDPQTIFVCDIEGQSTTGHLVLLDDSSPRRPTSDDESQKDDAPIPKRQKEEGVARKLDFLAGVVGPHPVVGKNKECLKKIMSKPSNNNKTTRLSHFQGLVGSRSSNPIIPQTDSKDSSFEPSGICSEPTIRRGNTLVASDVAAAVTLDHKSDPVRLEGTGRAEMLVQPQQSSTVAVPSQGLRGASGNVIPSPADRTNTITNEIAQTWVQMGQSEKSNLPMEETAAPPPRPSLKMLPPTSCSTNAMAVLPSASGSYRVRRRTLRERLGGGGRAITIAPSSRHVNDLLDENNQPRKGPTRQHPQRPSPQQRPEQHLQQQHRRQTAPSRRLWQRKPIGTRQTTTTTPTAATTLVLFPQRPPSPNNFSTNGTTSGSAVAAAVNTPTTTAIPSLRSRSFSLECSITNDNEHDNEDEESSLSTSSSTRCYFHEQTMRESSLRSI
jgi:hypothetical protein